MTLMAFFRASLLTLMLIAPVLAAAEQLTVNKEDRFENWNRKVFAFNETADRYFMKPLAEGYKFIMPSFLFYGVTNTFSTLGEIPTAANSLLQAKPKHFGIAVSRFVINATIGFFGLFDVATELGIEQQKEDFGQTLARWGVPSGQYFMLPFLGPATLRDGVGLVPDIFLFDPIYVDNVRARNSLYALRFTDKRASLLDAESLITGDRYQFIRDAYFQRREYLLNDGVVVDTFGEEDLEEDWLE